MRFTRILLPLGLTVLLASFAVPAQTSRTAKQAISADPQIHVEPINTEGLKSLISKPKNKPLLVNFWATWCDPCRDEFPDLVKIRGEFEPATMDFVTVSLDEVPDIETKVIPFLVKMNAKMPAYLLNVNDPEPAINAVDPKWQGDLPATFLFNEKGEILFKHLGRVDTDALREALKKLPKKS